MNRTEILGAIKALSEQISECESIDKTNCGHSIGIFCNRLIDYANRIIQIEDRCHPNDSDDYDLSEGIYFDLEIINDKTKPLMNNELPQILHSEITYLTEIFETVNKQLKETAADLPRENPVSARKETIQSFEAAKDRKRKAEIHFSKVKSQKPSSNKIEQLEAASKRLSKATGHVKDLAQERLCEGRSRSELYRHVLQQYGFLLSPENMPIAAVFPRRDWLELDSPKVDLEFQNFRARSECLMREYEITTDERYGLLRGRDKNVGTRGLHKLTGCVCISWVLLGTETLASGGKKYVFVPVLGLSGSKPNAKNREDSLEFYNRIARHCALPRIEKLSTSEVDLAESESRLGVTRNSTYELIMERSQKLSLDYEIRKILDLRLPSRQAMLSYIIFDNNHERITDTSEENSGSLEQPVFYLNQWHSFNCAEPAAMALASSVFCDGHDVTICFPFEGKNYSPQHLPRPKETCEWCALVELAFRSIGGPDVLTPSEESEQVQATEKLVTEGLPEILHKPRGKLDLFHELQSARRNANIFKVAYEHSSLEKMEKIRKLFHAIGVLTEGLIKEPKLKQLGADSIES